MGKRCETLVRTRGENYGDTRVTIRGTESGSGRDIGVPDRVRTKTDSVLDIPE